MKKRTYKQDRKRRAVLRLVIGLLTVALLAAAVLAVLNLKPVGTGEEVIEEAWKTPEYLRDKTMNILICGIDEDENRESQEMAMMTDVIMVCNLDLEADKATLFQIPRDTYVGTDVVYYGKINGLYNWGRLDDENVKPGIGALVSVINEDFALPVDNYVMITMEGFRKAIDIMGGIEVTLDKDMVFNIKDEDEKVIGQVELNKGVNVLDGVTADLFVRYRDYTNADIDRMNVQRYFLAALMSKVFSTPTSELVSLVRAIFPYLETDFSVAECISLALKVKDMSMDSVTMIRAPGEGVNGYGERKLSVFSVHKKELADMLNEYMRPYNDSVPETELGAIEIQNTYNVLDEQGVTLGEYTGTSENEGD